MVEYKQGNLLTDTSEALVNAVNCVGVMGGGIAAQFKQAFPEYYEDYKRACEANELQLGTVHTFATGQIVNPKWLVSFPTKDHWKEDSQMASVRTGLLSLREWLETSKIASIAIPALGCGLGGLSWETVKPEIETALAGLITTAVFVYEPHSAQ